MNKFGFIFKETEQKVKAYPRGEMLPSEPEDREKMFDYNMRMFVEEMIGTLYDLHELTKKELTNLLTKEEALVIMRAFHSTRYTVDGRSPKQILLMNLGAMNCFEYCEDGLKGATRTLVEKIKKLSEFQCHVLIMMNYELLNSRKHCFEIYDEEINKAFLIEK
ncbi:hypothetical protein [Ruminiclostridium cellobioparum]|uniref:hypothetical protein n=1 Tax=Ruminiclostridium cellobioparum TaxID=29355 RepID=UPI000482BDCF|nr:hypothetical protein [Ruminiclostridium cellobioparum]